MESKEEKNTKELFEELFNFSLVNLKKSWLDLSCKYNKIKIE